MDFYTNSIKKKFSCKDILSMFSISVNGERNILCPLPGHKEKTPSFHLYEDTDTFNCFGCGRGGDCIKLYADLEGISNTDAFVELCRRAGIEFTSRDKEIYKIKETELHKNREVYLSFKDMCKAELEKFEDIIEFCNRIWGFKTDILKKYEFGFCSTAVYPALLEKYGKIRLVEAGLMNGNGWRVFQDRIINHYPGTAGEPVFFIGRATPRTQGFNGKEPVKYFKTLTKSSDKGVSDTVETPLFILRGKGNTTYITEGIADAISIHEVTGETVISPTTTKFKNDDFDKVAHAVKHYKEVIIVNDNEENQSGEKGAVGTVRELRKRRIKGIKFIELPRAEGVNKIDINDFLKVNPPEVFQKLPTRKLWEIMADSTDKSNLEGVKSLFIELIEEEGEEEAAIHLEGIFSDSFHLKYIEKKKYERLFRGTIKKLEEQAKDSVDKKIAENIEEQEKAELLTDEDFRQAEVMAKRPDIMAEIFTDIKNLGVVGEETNTAMVYLAGTSRKMKKPLKLNLRGDTCTGKNTIVNKVIDMFPKDEVIDASRMSKQALAYMGRTALQSKILIITEDEGSEEAGYNLRILQSEDGINTLVPIKDPKTGMLRTVKYEVLGPTATISTTNKIKLYQDNETRVIVLYVDTSTEQNRRVVESIKEKHSSYRGGEESVKEAICRKHQAFQKMLEPVEVVIPYFNKIDFPTGKNRTRRDIDQFASIIKAVAFLRQHQKEVKHTDTGDYIEADLTDYNYAYSIAIKIFQQTLSDISPNAQKLLDMLVNKWSGNAHTLTNQIIERKLKLSGSFVRKYMKELRDTVYIEVSNSGTKGKGHNYEYILTVEPGENYKGEELGITTPEELEALLQDEVCVK